MPGFNLQRFLDDTGISLHKLATHLQVAESYLGAAVAGTACLTRRDETACRLLRRRLTKWRQLDLPFAESINSFSREHARAQARARVKAAKKAPSRKRTAATTDPGIANQVLFPPSSR